MINPREVMLLTTSTFIGIQLGVLVSRRCKKPLLSPLKLGPIYDSTFPAFSKAKHWESSLPAELFFINLGSLERSRLFFYLCAGRGIQILQQHALRNINNKVFSGERLSGIETSYHAPHLLFNNEAMLLKLFANDIEGDRWRYPVITPCRT